jgi:Tfp pilus assembly protein PilO
METSSQQKRWLWVGGVIVLLILVGAYVVVPAIQSQSRIREEVRNKQETLAKSPRVIAEKGRYQQGVAALQTTLQQGASVVFVGDKLPVTAAAIQDLLHAMGQETGITIVRENVRPPKKVEMLTEVAVELSIQGDIRGVRDFFYKIQTAPKLLTLPKVVIRSLPVRGPTGVAAELLVAGYLLTGEEKGPASPQSSSNAGT